MKKTFYTLLALMMTSTVIFGQLSLRPQVGINFPSFSEDITHGKFDGNAGFQFGVDLQIGSTFYVQPGINFQTAKLSIDDVGDMKIGRINVPVMIGYKLFEGSNEGAFGLRLFVGPNFAFNINKDLDEAFSGFDEDDIKDFLVSGIAGAGLDISIFFVDLGYNFGFGDLIDGDNVDQGGTLNMFIANAGIRIGF